MDRCVNSHVSKTIFIEIHAYVICVILQSLTTVKVLLKCILEALHLSRNAMKGIPRTYLLFS